MFLLRQATHRMILQYHPRFGHLYVPNLTARIPSERGGYLVRTNSAGFRSDVEFVRPRGRRPRLLFFGDSFTAGDGCDNAERFPELVGEALDAEVYNFGLSGSGTDQQLLIHEEVGREIEADLVVLCVVVHNIDRITVSHRASIDRLSGQRIMVPKPYFTLEDGVLQSHHIPVPLVRPQAGDGGHHDQGDLGPSWLGRALGIYRASPRLARLRQLAGNGSSPAAIGLRSHALRLSRFQPHPGYRSPDTPQWRLMEAILRRFVAGSTPVLVVPIPTYYFYLYGVEPTYQRLFDRLDEPSRGVHVADLTTPLRAMPLEERVELTLPQDGHFSPQGNRRIAGMITEHITSRGVLPARPARPPAKRATGLQPTRPLSILGISCFYHNSAASLIRDGRIVAAAEEERFTRRKNDRGFPHQAINYCLEEGGLHPRDLAAVVYYDNTPMTMERLLHTQAALAPEGLETWLQVMPSWAISRLRLPRQIRRDLRYDGLLLQEEHHRSHAASAFYPSPFDEAAILTVDGVGEWATATIGIGSGADIRLLRQMEFPHSLGLLYSAFTQFTGFKVNSGEYKMMGLAPYGEPRYVQTILDHLVDLKPDGSVELNLEYFGFLGRPTMTNERFAELFGGPARKPDGWITQREMDLARSVQAVTEESILRMGRHAHELTGAKRLCMAGGVALNCVANGRLLREGPFEELWIQPAAGDAGGALGAALDVYHTYFGKPRTTVAGGRAPQGGSLWGPAFSNEEVTAFLQTHGYPFRMLAPEERAVEGARQLAEGKVVGHFAGRMEFGPRALGGRSILGDPRNGDMQATLNLKIKYRESFRPFAPTVLSECTADYFDLRCESPYMLLVAPVRHERQHAVTRAPGDDLTKIVRQQRSDIPAVTHVDYSARVQTITRSDHPPYHDLINEFRRLTGCGVIVNTSFNVRGEPIVCTPYDAYRCFMRTEMDVLLLGNALLLKEEQPSWPEAKGHVEREEEPETETGIPPALLTGLRRIYTAEFCPAAARLRQAGGLRIDLRFRRVASTWTQHSSPASADAIFAIPPAWDADHPKATEAAAAIARHWAPGPASEALQSLLVRLLELTARFPEASLGRERVSDSVYVLY
jgi:carbamoyltransferase